MTAKRKRKPSALESTAYHEAGHAVAAFMHDIRFRHVSIVPSNDGESLGRLLCNSLGRRFRPDLELTPATRWRLERHVLMDLTGPAAETKFTGQRNNRGAVGDMSGATDLASYLHFDVKVVDAYLTYMQYRAKAFVEWNTAWMGIESLAKELLEKRHVPERGALEAIRRGMDKGVKT